MNRHTTLLCQSAILQIFFPSVIIASLPRRSFVLYVYRPRVMMTLLLITLFPSIYLTCMTPSLFPGFMCVPGFIGLLEDRKKFCSSDNYSSDKENHLLNRQYFGSKTPIKIEMLAKNRGCCSFMPCFGTPGGFILSLVTRPSARVRRPSM